MDRANSVAGMRTGRYNGAVAFVIRDFQTEDFDLIWRMDQECFPPGIAYSKPELRAYVRNRGAFTLLATGAEDGRSSWLYRGPGRSHWAHHHDRRGYICAASRCGVATAPVG